MVKLNILASDNLFQAADETVAFLIEFLVEVGMRKLRERLYSGCHCYRISTERTGLVYRTVWSKNLHNVGTSTKGSCWESATNNLAYGGHIWLDTKELLSATTRQTESGYHLIENEQDILMICRALTEENPVHTADLSGWRTPEDMASEWRSHNLAYSLLPADSPSKGHAKDVDLDAKDSGKTSLDFLLERTGIGR